MHSQVKINSPARVVVVDTEICSAQVNEPLEESIQMLLNHSDIHSIYLEDGREIDCFAERIGEPGGELGV